jgi:hypothetical protein
MSNYFIGENDTWFISDGKSKVKCEFSDSLEIAYRQGLHDASVEKFSIAQKLAQHYLNESSIFLKDLDKMNDNLELNLSMRNKSSDEM